MKIIRVAFAYYDEIVVPDKASDVEIEEAVREKAAEKKADFFGWSDKPDDEFIVC